MDSKTTGIRPATDDTLPKPRLAVRVHEAARLLDVSRSTMYALLWSGEIRSIRVGKSLRIPIAMLEAWVEEHAASATAIAANERKGGGSDGTTRTG